MNVSQNRDRRGLLFALLTAVCGATGGFDQSGTANNASANSFSVATTGSLAQATEIAFCQWGSGAIGGSIPNISSSPFGKVNLSSSPFAFFYWEITSSTTVPACAATWSSSATSTVVNVTTFKIP